MSEHICTQDCWYVAKRRGRLVRGRNRCTGAWEPHWWPEQLYPTLPRTMEENAINGQR